jgi:hypothetical protein
MMGQEQDSLRRRNKHEDSITISYRYLDSTRLYKLDSTITDFDRRFPIPSTHIHLGNIGTATKSLLFSPEFKAGFDPGFHAFDVYTWKMNDARFYQTTRPYSELNYFLGTRSEQMIHILHTQNIRPTWNAAFQYHMINSPGFFKNQKSNHHNYFLTSRYQSNNLRYTNYFVLIGNKLGSSENGGIVDTSNILNDPIFKDRFNIPVHLGGDQSFSSNFFSTKIATGNKYSLFSGLLRQQYDLGRKDSLVTDSTVIPLFYPRLRFEHTLRLDQGKYVFLDEAADSGYYKLYYDTTLRKRLDTFRLQDRWQSITNDLSIYQFPDANNLHQYIRVGIMLQNLTGETVSGKRKFFNTAGHAEYRNKTRNQMWDILAKGELYFTGLNAADYAALISLQRLLGKKLGYLRLGFENTSRTPSFVFDSRSSFYLMKSVIDFKKENNTHLFASYFLPSFRLRLSGDYYLMTNYTYLTNYFELRQESALFNVLRITVEKTIKLGKRWNWHADIYLQQVIGDAPVHITPLFTRQRIAYEGNLGFKNLDIAIGLEARYRAPYKADGYSPLLGRFSYQDTVTITNKLPDISAYLNFRIKPFKAFVRVDNLNTAQDLEGFGFTRNNAVAPGYFLPGLQFRLGIYWSFVN